MRTKRGAAALAAVAVLIPAGGCSDGDDEAAQSSGEDASAVADGTDALAGGGGAGATGAVGGGSGTAQPGVPAGEPISVAVGEVQVVRTASLRVSVPEGDFGVAFASASQVATTLGGFVQSSSTSSYEAGEASGEVTLRVPVDRFDDAVEQLGALGEVESTQLEGDDVTGELVDMAARLRSMRAEEEALNALLLEAQNVQEVLTVRETLSGVRQAIEQLAAQEASLRDRAAYSTVSIVLHEGSDVTASAESDDRSLGDAVETAVDVAENVVGGAIVLVGFLVPFAPAALLAWALVRRHQRRRDEVVAA